FFDKNTQKPRIMGLFLSVHDSGYSSTTVLGLFLFVANIKACEMNWMGARKKSCGLFKMRASYE
ncbi:hypothetical protein, partial [Bacillus cereus group sp. N28]|uniref:hypothetical protein n=1 Tax=Bacillus cereus group sp. N28 TaxID=2794593 RepID=UPI001A7E920B